MGEVHAGFGIARTFFPRCNQVNVLEEVLARLRLKRLEVVRGGLLRHALNRPCKRLRTDWWQHQLGVS